MFVYCSSAPKPTHFKELSKVLFIYPGRSENELQDSFPLRLSFPMAAVCAISRHRGVMALKSGSRNGPPFLLGIYRWCSIGCT